MRTYLQLHNSDTSKPPWISFLTSFLSHHHKVPCWLVEHMNMIWISFLTSFLSHHHKVPCWLVEHMNTIWISFLTSFLSHHHKVPCWLVEHMNMIWISFLTSFLSHHHKVPCWLVEHMNTIWISFLTSFLSHHHKVPYWLVEQRVLHWNFLTSFPSDHHKVPCWMVEPQVLCWLVEHVTMVWVWFSTQMIVIYLIWLYQIPPTTNRSLPIQGFVWNQCPSFLCYDLAQGENVATTLPVFVQDIHCDMLTGWNIWMTGSLEHPMTVCLVKVRSR